nr:uncharacterized protein LOC121816973 isoform X1 [Ovis aries]
MLLPPPFMDEDIEAQIRKTLEAIPVRHGTLRALPRVRARPCLLSLRDRSQPRSVLARHPLHPHPHLQAPATCAFSQFLRPEPQGAPQVWTTSSLPCSSFNLSPPGDGGPTSQTPPLTSQQGQHPYCMLPFPPSWELRKRRDQEHWRHRPPRARGLPTVCHGVIHTPQICSECMEPRSPRFNPCPLMPFPQGCRQALSRPLPVKPSPLPCLQPG